MRFSLMKFSDGKNYGEVMHETNSASEAKKKFKDVHVKLGEQLVLRSHLNGEVKVVGIRDNGYCA